MEPRSVERGNIRDPLLGIAILRASMEPRSVERGNSGRGDGSMSALRASMEPRSVERGNPKRAGRPCKPRSCFNGATLSRTGKRVPLFAPFGNNPELQWSHAQSNVETAIAPLGDPRQFVLQWSHAQSNVET